MDLTAAQTALQMSPQRHAAGDVLHSHQCGLLQVSSGIIECVQEGVTVELLGPGDWYAPQPGEVLSVVRACRTVALRRDALAGLSNHSALLAEVWSQRLKRAQFLRCLLSLPASARLQAWLDRYGDRYADAPQCCLASLLGMAPETLSRARRARA